MPHGCIATEQLALDARGVSTAGGPCSYEGGQVFAEVDRRALVNNRFGKDIGDVEPSEASEGKADTHDVGETTRRSHLVCRS